MGLSTHVLDTMNGCPAAGMAVALYSTDGDQATLIKSLVLNHDGRTDAPLFDNNSLRTGTYRLTFDVAAYFKARGVTLLDRPFNHGDGARSFHLLDPAGNKVQPLYHPAVSGQRLV